MHIFFSGIGGAGTSALAMVAHQLGHHVSGSDEQDTPYIHYLRQHGIVNIHIGQDRDSIEHIHSEEPIDWYVRSSAIPDDSPELLFCQEQNIKTSKRDGLLNQILSDHKLKLVAIAGTHGKTTTTAMVVWLFKQLGLPISYLVGSKIPFGDMGRYQKQSEYFVYECDEFDRNFLAFRPYLSLISGVSWDHHEIFPTREDYQQAFKEFIDQSEWTILWQEDFDYLGLRNNNRYSVQDTANPQISNIQLAGLYNRLDAWLAIQAVHNLTEQPLEKLIELMNGFPGLQRRMEPIIPGLYSDYAHTPEKIRGAMSVALEMAEKQGKRLVVVYEPLTNRRQHYMIDDYQDCFTGASRVYWLPSYLAREDPNQRVIPPQELIAHLSDPSIAAAAERDARLKQIIQQHLDNGDMVVGMAGGGGGSLDDWLREIFTKPGPA